MSIWAWLVNLEHRIERALGLTPPPDVTEDVRPATLRASAGVPSTGNDDPIVGPAYSWLAGWTPTDRRALLDAQRTIGLDPSIGALLAVFDHESKGNPAALNPLPAAGLLQLTTGARLPGFLTPDAVREVATWTPARQLADVVVPFYRRTFAAGVPQGVDDGVMLLRRNFLPGLASQPAGYVLAVKPGATGPNGETSDDRIAGGLTRGAIYTSNAGFDRAGRGYFTWADVDQDAARSVAAGRRGWMRVSGTIVASADPPMAGAAPSAAPDVSSLDPVTWVQIPGPGGYRLWTNADALARGGVPQVFTFRQLLAVARALNALPLTRQISDARWNAATVKTIVPPLNDPRGALDAINTADGRAQAATFAARYGNVGTALRHGGHKEMILGPQLKPEGKGSMLFYDWRCPGGGVIQRGISSDHDKDWSEYDSFGDVVRRDAIDPSGNPVDLVAVLAAGGSPLMDGRLPNATVAELGGVSPLATIAPPGGIGQG
jgi:hypothetical protein